MSLPIRWRIAIPYVLLILVSMLALGAFISGFIRQTYIADLESKLADQARMIGDIISPDLKSAGESPNLDAQAKHWADLLGTRVTIIAPDGTVWGESDEDRTRMANHSDRPEVINALRDGTGSTSRFSQTLGYPMLYTAVRISENLDVLGIVRIALPLQQIDANIANLQKIMLAATILVTILAIILAALIAARISRPVRDLTSTAWQLAYDKPENTPLPLGGDEIGQLTSVFNTMSARLSDEITELEAERATLLEVLQKMTDGVFIIDAQGDIQLVNPAAEKMFSISHQAVYKKPLIEVIRHHQLIQLWQNCRNTNEVQQEDFEISNRLSLHGIATSLSPVIPGSTLLFFQDLTRQKQIEAMRRDFISNVSHELRTPLAAIKALTETLQAGALEDPPAAQRFLMQMETEVDSLSLMVSELLELSRIESGRVPLKFAPTRPMEIVNQAQERLHLQAERAGLTLRVNCPDDLAEVMADGSRVQQVVVNLLHNAIKFTPTGGVVTVSAKPYDGYICFTVEDTGIGISKEDLPRIFERFYKVDRSRTSSGTGLGLAIARHLVEAHGGRIWAESDIGRGSAFHFTIPLA